MKHTPSNTATQGRRRNDVPLVAEYSEAPKTGPMAGPTAWLDLNIIENGQRRHVETVAISGKAEARRIAKARNAVCWNF